MFENPRRGRQARNFTTNAPKILDLKSSSEQIFSRKLPLGAPEFWVQTMYYEVIQVSKVIKISAMTKRLPPYVRRYNNVCLTFI